MSTTLTDRRPALVQARRYEQDRLALHRQARQAVCGCSNCGDAERGHELDVLIRIGLERAAYLSNQITDRRAP